MVSSTVLASAFLPLCAKERYSISQSKYMVPFVLPGAAATRMTMTMNARELLHFFSLRMCNRAQWEIRELAWQMYALVYPLAPSVFENAGPGCAHGACPEGKRSCGKADEVRRRLEEVKKQ